MSPQCILTIIGLVAAVYSLMTPSRIPLAVSVIFLAVAMLVGCLH
jgi:hypothetical protein